MLKYLVLAGFDRSQHGKGPLQVYLEYYLGAIVSRDPDQIWAYLNTLQTFSFAYARSLRVRSLLGQNIVGM